MTLIEETGSGGGWRKGVCFPFFFFFFFFFYQILVFEC